MKIGMLIFPEMTLLDFAGPYEVFSKLPGCQVKVISKSLAAVRVNGGFIVLPDTSISDNEPIEMLFVPGGPGVGAVLEDFELVEYVRVQGLQANYITSVCTGALILGAAGLLQGYRAGTHWLSLDLLPLFGADPVPERVVIDGNRITGGGVTAGIDFGLTIAAQLFGESTAKSIQLLMEYDPQPLFTAGHPSVADSELVLQVAREREPLQLARLAQANRAAKWYCTT